MIDSTHEARGTEAQAPTTPVDFIVIGAAKSGTTTLYRYLARHEDVFMPELKEPEFFSRDDVYARGAAWYSELFAPATPGQIRGEASTTYTRWPHTADASERIARALPEARFIYIMRNPVDRAYSHYAHHMRLNVTMTFEEALEKSRIYLDCGLYMMQIERYLRFFSSDRFLFLLLDDLHRDPQETLGRVQDFLDVQRRPIAQEPLVANKSGPDHYLRKRTVGRIRRVPVLARIAYAVPKPIRARAFQLLRTTPPVRRIEESYQLPPMKPETRRELLRFYEEPNRRLADYLQHDLSHWNT